MDTRTFGEREDKVSGAIEAKTAKLPSSTYLGAAVTAMGVSALLKVLGKDDWSLFIGQWAPSFLIMGLYNKVVKQLGSDAYTSSRAA